MPTEPIQVARAERIELQGGDPFRELSIPQAVLKFKQGFGRLVRHRDDRGVVLVLDTRISNKSYGRSFLRSLPSAIRPMRGSRAEILEALSGFLAERQARA